MAKMLPGCSTGFAGSLSDKQPRVGRPESSDKEDKIAKARQMTDQGKGCREIARR